MKKLLFTFLFIVASIACWAEEHYLVGGCTDSGWGKGETARSTVRCYTSDGTTWVWAGKLITGDGDDGRFKIPSGLNNFEGYWAPSQEYVLTSEWADLSTDGTGDYKYKVSEEGYYLITFNTSTEQIKAEKLTGGLSTSGDYYLISSVDDYYWFAAYIASDDTKNAKAKLTADLDFSGKTFIPLASDKYKFGGEFDGDGHTISNISLNVDAYKAIGLFCYATSGATIKNLVVGGAFIGQTKVGGIVGFVRDKSGTETVTLTNVVNMAKVSSANVQDANAAGLVGCATDGVKIVATNCANTGAISGKDGECAAFAGWTQTGTTFTNCWNIGDISNMQGNYNLYRNIEAVTATNCYDLTNKGTQGEKVDASKASTGEFCYTLNGDQSNIIWYQNLSGTKDAQPVPFSSHAQVYENADYQCDGVTPKGTNSYSNVSGPVSSHSFVNNLCSFCKAVGEEPDNVDGVYQIANIGHLIWFASHVNSGNTTAEGVLTDDIVQGDAVYVPIGTKDNIYKGHFDGQGHTVNLALNNPSLNYQGLFGVVTDGVFIEKVTVTGSVSGNDYVGGIVGGTNGGSSNASKTNIWYCGNEATITAEGANAGGIIGVNMSGSASIILTNCYNSGNITGARESGALSGWLGGGWSSVRNCYNTGTVKNGEDASKAFGRNSGCYFKNCYYTTSSGTDNTGENTGNGRPTEVADDAVASGVLCAKLGYGFRQNLGEDDYPNFNQEHGFVNQIGEVGYSTQYNAMSDVTIPDGVEAFAGVKNGDRVTLVSVENKIKAGVPVVLKGAEGCYNFMPTTGAGEPDANDLRGSDGSVAFGENIYVLAKKSHGIGFYKTEGSGKYVPEGRAYLDNSGSSVKEAYLFSFDDEETAIANVNVNGNGNNAAIYNMAGQRISKLQKGINIVNGKKVLF